MWPRHVLEAYIREFYLKAASVKYGPCPRTYLLFMGHLDTHLDPFYYNKTVGR